MHRLETSMSYYTWMLEDGGRFIKRNFGNPIKYEY